MQGKVDRFTDACVEESRCGSGTLAYICNNRVTFPLFFPRVADSGVVKVYAGIIYVKVSLIYSVGVGFKKAQ